MDLKTLKQFLINSSKLGYGAGDGEVAGRIKKDEADGSHTIEVQIGNIRMHDNYFGGEPYAGQETIFENGVAQWVVVYYGTVDSKADSKVVYPVLQAALINPDPNFPVRGPKFFSKDGFVYEYQSTGDLDNFEIHETIIGEKDGVIVYNATFCGGFVDQRK